MQPLKLLEKSFTYNNLITECQKQGWRIPSKEELKGNKLPYPIFVSDEPEDKHYAMMYDGTTEVLVSREHFSEKAGVFKLPCEWLVYDPAYAKTGCGQVTIHQYGYKYCPYCSREIKFTQKEV